MKQSRTRSAKKKAKSKRLPKTSPGTPDQHCVVGVGASAGGLEAFTSFLKVFPTSSEMAVVYVQHLDPKHPSYLHELLAKHTAMPVLQVTDGVAVKPNCVYVIPPNSSITIRDNKLHLHPRDSEQKLHLPIDEFFTSLAEEKAELAIGVLLSGNASDGTLGLKAIKAAGGITFAQTEDSAKFRTMPRHATDAGFVDFQLSPEEIATELGRIRNHPLMKDPTFTSGGDGKAAALTQIYAALKKRSGVDFTFYKPSTLERRISRRMLLQKQENLDSYARYVKENPGETEGLFDDLLINVTSFFRDSEAFEALRADIFPKLENRRTGTWRIWVPGCSTGEEVYSIAIVLLEYLGDRVDPKQIQIFGTDVSEKAINKARAGMYPAGISNDVSPGRLRRFFRKTEHGYTVNKFIRDLCIFARHNVTKDPPFSKLDLISCRNLLIYFGPVLQKRVIPIFHYALNPGGFLLLGENESISGFADFFFPADRTHKLYSRKTTQSRLHFDQREEQAAVAVPAPREPFLLPDRIVSEKDIAREGDRLILSQFSPPSVIVDGEMNILHFRGDTNRFLQHSAGQASLNLMKLAREGLLSEIRALMAQVKKQNNPARKTGIRIKIEGEAQTLDLEITPFSIPRSPEQFYLVLFETQDGGKKQRGRALQKSTPKRERDSIEVQSLQRELSATKEYLQSIIEEQEATMEELRAANEEILSTNEELQSTNEEMETAKEELQSANEELTTVNEELQNRNVELNRLNNDLENLLSSVNLPIIMLGRDLRIRSITVAAEKTFNLIRTDIGRPISQIKLSVKVEQLERWIHEVIDTMHMKEIEVQDSQSRWHQLQIRPYITMDNRIDGAVLVFMDVSDIRKRAT